MVEYLWVGSGRLVWVTKSGAVFSPSAGHGTEESAVLQQKWGSSESKGAHLLLCMSQSCTPPQYVRSSDQFVQKTVT